MFSQLLYALFAWYAVKRVVVIYRARRDYGHIPGYYALFGPFSLIGAATPTNWWNPGLGHTFRDRKTLYKNITHKTMVIIPIFAGIPMVYSSSLHLFRQTLSVNSVWVRPEMALEDLRLFGENVFASVGETWKRHRRILAPAFTQSLYKNVWSTSQKMYGLMCEEDGWGGKDVVEVEDINQLTRKVTLYVITICGFGLPMSWTSPERDAQGHMSIEKMAFEIAANILIRSRTPKWLYWLGLEKLKTIDEAYKSFGTRMRELVGIREREIDDLRSHAQFDASADLSEGMKDIFGKLVAARMGEGKLALSDEECISDCFIMLLAGHETSANTLSATIAMLALYQEEQERVYQIVKDVLGDRQQPEIEDYEKLDEILACFCEALRLFPPAYINFREPTEDTMLLIPHQDNPEIVDKMYYKKGAIVIQDYIGIGYDPELFPNPESFNPRRWTTASPYQSALTPSAPPFPASKPHTSTPSLPPVPNPSTLDTFHGFSTGPRTCLGHKFAKMEAVCLLANLLREWRFEVDLSAVGAKGDEKGEELDEVRRRWREEVMYKKSRFEITFSFPKLPVRFVRRKDVGV